MSDIVKPKLLVTGSTFPRWKDDTEPRFVLDLSLALADYFDVTVLVPAAPGAEDEERWGEVTVKRYHYFPIHKWETLCYPGAVIPRIKEKKVRSLLVPFLVLSLWWHLLRMLSGFDVVHAHWLVPQGIVQSCFKKPYLVTGHGGDVTELNNGLLKALKIRCINRANAVTVVSSYQYNKVMALTPDKKVNIIPMGCNTDFFGPQYREEGYFKQPKGKKVILFVGRLAEIKGVNFLIDAMAKIDNAILVIVGSGPEEDKLKKQAETYSDKVRFLGSKTHEELRKVYASADIFAAASIRLKEDVEEGLPLVFLEAMASGLPVVATQTGGVPDLVEPGINGFLVPPSDSAQLAEKINTLLVDAGCYASTKENALKTAEEYSYKAIGERYAKILNSVLEN